MSAEEKASITQQLSDIEEWVEHENTRSLGSEEDEKLYRQRIEEIQKYMHPFEVLQQRKEKGGRLNMRHQELITKIEQAKPKVRVFLR